MSSRRSVRAHTLRTPEDCGWFDGSADPNPGGRLGMGWHWILRDGNTAYRCDSDGMIQCAI
jgi:hypothetical protein